MNPRTILPRVLAGYQRLGVGPDRLPKFAREQAMELHNRRVKDMRESSVALAHREFVHKTTWHIVKQETKP